MEQPRRRRPPPRGCSRRGHAFQGPARRRAGREVSLNHAFLGSERETSAWCATRWDERGSRARTSAANGVHLYASRRTFHHRGMRHHAFDCGTKRVRVLPHPQPGHAAHSWGALPRGGPLAFFPSRARSVPRTPRSSLPTIAIGQRVFVTCPCPPSEVVALGDETGKQVSTVGLTDGLEVEVIAWRPRGANDTRYRVRVPSTGADGWLPAANLRKLLVPPPAAALPSPASGASASSAKPVATAAGGRRRFGQPV